MQQAFYITIAGEELRNGSILTFELLSKHMKTIDLYKSELNCYVSVDANAFISD